MDEQISQDSEVVVVLLRVTLGIDPTPTHHQQHQATFKHMSRFIMFIIIIFIYSKYTVYTKA